MYLKKENSSDICVTNRPIIIWGTKDAAKICFRVLHKLNIDIVAMGDNHAAVGGDLYDIPVLSLQEIKNLYPNALIVIGSFFRHITDIIMRQLQEVSSEFSFFRFEQLEYLYETECSSRVIEDKERLHNIIFNIAYGNGSEWEREIHKGVIPEYRYIIYDDKSADLKAFLHRIYGVRDLVLIIRQEYEKCAVQLIEELSGFNNIGHINIAVDWNSPLSFSVMEALSYRIFYVICDKEVSMEFTELSARAGLPIVKSEIADEVFRYRESRVETTVTETEVVESIFQYTGMDRNEEQAVYTNKPVYIVQIFNGLANQALMYLFGKYVEEVSGRLVVFDDSIVCLDVSDEKENLRRIHKWIPNVPLEEMERGLEETRKRNSFYSFRKAELAEVFDVPVRLLSDYFDETVWSLYLKKIKNEHSMQYAQSFPLGHVLQSCGMDIGIVRDSLLPEEFFCARNCWEIDTHMWGKAEGKKAAMDVLLNECDNLYFMGGWADNRIRNWLFDNRDWSRQQLPFRLKLNKRNRLYEDAILHTDAIMIHIRRGDFLYFRENIHADLLYYRNAIQSAEQLERYDNRQYFIFSDDIPWCRDNEEELGIDKIKDRVTFVSGNEGADSYMDLYLISLGKVIIPAPGSTFAYLAILLSESVEMCTNMPEYCYYSERALSGSVNMLSVIA